jgi:predicted dehydrogenase
MEVKASHRVGIVGCGFFAPNHARGWAHLPRATIGALCDRDEARAERLAEMLDLDVPIFNEVTAMADHVALDFIDIITTPPSHPALIAFAAERQLAAIVQKPMALTLPESTKMVALMRQAGLPFMVHENFRFQTPIAAVGEIVRSGEIGSPVYARIAFRTGFDIYAGQPYLAQEKRFVLADLGVHVLDVARFLLGEFTMLSCLTQRVKSGIAGEDMATVLCRSVSGATCIIECSYASRLPADHFPQTLIAVEGIAGSVHLNAEYEVVVNSSSGMRRFVARPAALPWSQPPWDAVHERRADSAALA